MVEEAPWSGAKAGWMTWQVETNNEFPMFFHVFLWFMIDV
jgi:hypothetical protein